MSLNIDIFIRLYQFEQVNDIYTVFCQCGLDKLVAVNVMLSGASVYYVQ